MLLMDEEEEEGEGGGGPGGGERGATQHRELNVGMQGSGNRPSACNTTNFISW